MYAEIHNQIKAVYMKLHTLSLLLSVHVLSSFFCPYLLGTVSGARKSRGFSCI